MQKSTLYFDANEDTKMTIDVKISQLTLDVDLSFL